MKPVAVKERPILFNGDMVRAILEGRKTMTRRVVKPQPENAGYWTLHQNTPFDGAFYPNTLKANPKLLICPYGIVGNQFWVRETHYRWGHWIKNGISTTGRQRWAFRADGKGVRYFDNPPAFIPTPRKVIGSRKRPSIFMPRWASRIQLEITGVRVERVQEISDSDCDAEGIRYDPVITNARQEFKELWDSIGEKRGYGWDTNPWVWVIEFKRIDK